MTPTYDEIKVGDETVLAKGSITTAHIVRWLGAVENWHRIHYDYPFATGHDGLPGVLVNGSWKQHILVQLLKDWIGTEGWVYRIRFRYVAMDLAGTTVTARAVVAKKEILEGLGFVTVNLEICNGEGVASTTGTAIVIVPVNGGPAVPYPLPKSAAFRAVEF